MADSSVWQLVRRAAARRLKRWADEILLADGASSTPPAPVATPAPPQATGVRVGQGGPPANWLADIQKRAPHLIVDGQFLAAEQSGASAPRWPAAIEPMPRGVPPSSSVPHARPAPTAATATSRTLTERTRRAGTPGGLPPAASEAPGTPHSRRAPPEEAPLQVALPAVHAAAATPDARLDRPAGTGGEDAGQDRERQSATNRAARATHSPPPAPEPPRASPYRASANRAKDRPPRETMPPLNGADLASAPRSIALAISPPAASVWARPLRPAKGSTSPGTGAVGARAVRPERLARSAGETATTTAPRPARTPPQPVGAEPARSVPDWFAAWVAARQESRLASEPRSGPRVVGTHVSAPAGPMPAIASATRSSPHFPSTSASREQASARRLAPTADPAWAADPWPTLLPTPALDAPDVDDLAVDLAAQERRRRLRREQAGLLT
jgi:hypothetical protein